MKFYKSAINYILVASFLCLCGCGGGGGSKGSEIAYINSALLSTEDSNTSDLNGHIINSNSYSNNNESNNNNNNAIDNNNSAIDENTDQVVTVKEQGIKKSWLFLVYISGDNDNILYDQLANIDSMETVGSDENTHVVVYIDIGNRSDKSFWDYYDWSSTINWDGARGYYIKKDTEEYKINSPIIAKYGTVDSGSKDFLLTCLKDGMSRYPADNVCLILNDHGAGIYGALLDDTEGTMMTNQDIKEAIQEAENETGMRVNILGFDACEMAQLEPAYEYKNVTDYIISSEELTSSIGWYYDDILELSNEVPIENEEEEEIRGFRTNLRVGLLPRITKAVQNKYINFSKSGTYSKIPQTVTPKQLAELIFNIHSDQPHNLCTFSVIETANIEKLATAVNTFATAVINTDSNNRAKVANCIKLNVDGTEAIQYGWEDFFDLYNMMDSIALNENITDTTIKDSANAVKERVTEVVIYNTNVASYDSNYANSYGISVFFTSTPSLMYSTDKEIYSTMAFIQETNWFEMMKKLEEKVK